MVIRSSTIKIIQTEDEEVYILFRKIIPIVAILFIVALALSNYFNKAEEKTFVIPQERGGTLG
ncbi:hypothetical protein AMS59_01085 [Lysinibacillus sp. FJAT-14745]|nr:hypothetical protein AMS59_01085 [Lysinibacillus sp. FJAT-14745]